MSTRPIDCLSCRRRAPVDQGIPACGWKGEPPGVSRWMERAEALQDPVTRQWDQVSAGLPPCPGLVLLRRAA